MDLIELETRASKGEDYPKGLTFEERELFENFRVLYFLLHNKQVSPEEAKKEKQLYLMEYKIRKSMVNQYREDIERKAAINDIVNRYGGYDKVPANVMDKLINLLDNCLYIDKSTNSLIKQVNEYLGLELSDEWILS